MACSRSSAANRRPASALRAACFSVVRHAGGGGFKSQMKKADASGAALALIVGEDELKAAAVTVKPLREARPQQQVARAARAARPGGFLQGSRPLALADLGV